VPILVSLLPSARGSGRAFSVYGSDVEDSPAEAILRIGGDAQAEELAVRSLLRRENAFPITRRDVVVLSFCCGPLMNDCADRILPILGRLLADPEESVRSAVVECLGDYGTRARPLIPALIAALQDLSVGVRCLAAWALARAAAGGQEDQAIPALLALVARAETCWAAARALGALGAPAVPALVQLLQQHAATGQSPFLHALKEIGRASVPALRRELTDPSATGRLGAIQALGILGTVARDTFADLVALLQDPDPQVRNAVAQALVEIAPEQARPALATLVGWLDAPTEEERRKAVSLLGCMRQAAKPALPALAKLLADPELGAGAVYAMLAIDPIHTAEVVLRGSGNATQRHAVVQYLTQLGRAAEPALALLGQTLTDPTLRRETAFALVAIAPEQADSAVPVFQEELERLGPADMSSQVPALLEALGRIGEKAASVEPLLRRHVLSQDAGIRISALVALARVVPAFLPEALPPLLRILADPEAICAGWDEASAALAELGPAARAAVPRLEELLFDEEKRRLWNPEALFSTLVRIDPAAKERVIAHIEAGLAGQGFDRAVGLLTDIASQMPAQEAPLLARLLHDPRAGGQWDRLLNLLAGFGAQARDAAPALQDLLKTATPEQADRIRKVLEQLR